MKTLVIPLMALATLGLGACGGDTTASHDHPAPPAAPDAAGGDRHGHDHGDEGPAHALGTVTIGAADFAVTRHGEITAGQEAVLGVTQRTGEPPAALRGWIGIEGGRGSLKGLLAAEGAGWHGHLAVPAPLPEGSAVWLEVEAADGSKASASLPLSSGHDHDHDH